MKRNKNLVTELALPKGSKLKIPDGLSEYLTQIDLAKAFAYFSEWQE